MLKYKEACKMVAEGFTSNDLRRVNYQEKKYSREDTFLLQEVLNIERKIFKIYVATGKHKSSNFPFEQIKCGYESPKKINKIAKMLLDFGWSPFIHTANTRKEYESINNGFW